MKKDTLNLNLAKLCGLALPFITLRWNLFSFSFTLFLIIISFFSVYLIVKMRKTIYIHKCDIIYIIFLIIALFSLLYSESASYGLTRYIKLLIVVILYFIYKNAFYKQSKYISIILKYSIYGMTIMLTYLAYIYLIKFDVNYIGLSTAYPTRESRNSLSFVIVIIFGFLVSDVLISLRNGNLSFFKILLLGYNFILSIIVQSRALFLIILFYLVIVLITFIKKQKQLRTMFALIIIIFAVFIFLPNSIKSSINDRFSTLATFFDDDYVEVNNSLSARSELLIRGYEIFKENTFFGSGFGSFMFYGGINSQISHNDYLLVLSEQGLVGFTVFIIMLFISVFYSIKNFVYRKNFANLSLLLSLFGVVIYFLFINAYDNILFWVILSFISVNYQENSLKNHEIENLYNLNLNLLEISYENNWFKGNTKC